MKNHIFIDINSDRFQEAYKYWLTINKGHTHPLTSMMIECGLRYIYRKQASKCVHVEVLDKTKLLVARLKYNI